jgi:fibro-slime domain-containing protein
MTSIRATSVTTYLVLGGAATAALILPRSLGVRSTVGQSATPETMQLTGVLRDFQASHPDFDVTSPEGFGHCAGNVGLLIDEYNRPSHTGGTATATGPEPARMLTGTYTGDGKDNRAITGLGFKPDFVLIKGNAEEPAVCRTSTMALDRSKQLVEAASIFTNRIQTLDADGFTLGSDRDVNDSGKSYYWVAFQANADAFGVGSYSGNGIDNRDITGLTFGPDYVIVMPEDSYRAWHYSAVMPVDRATPLDDSEPSDNRIQRLLPDGFQVGSSSDTNRTGGRFHFAAWKALPGSMKVGTYRGDGKDNRNIANVGFKPDYMIVRSNDEYPAVHRTLSLGAGDKTLLFEAKGITVNAIQELQMDGFQAGSASEVNRNGTDYYWAAFGPGGANTAKKGGFMVSKQWRNAAGAPMAPHMQGYGVQEQFTNYQLANQTIVPGQTFAAMFTLIGAAISNGSYDFPVTARVRIGDQYFEPFGPYASPVNGNLNDNQSVTGNANHSPRQVVLQQTFAPGAPVSISGRSWVKTNSSNSGKIDTHWQINREVDSLTNTSQSIMLRNGDAVPNYQGANQQANVAEYLKPFIDSTGRIALCESQVIFLFELGSSSGGDFQDLVVVVTLAERISDLPGTGGCGGDPLDKCGVVLKDELGTAGAASKGAITSSESFSEWFIDLPGVNQSIPHTITLNKAADGVFAFISNEFYPVDAALYGNEGQPHNNYFTYTIDARFTYDECARQFFEFEGADDCWMFVNGRLVIDLGGIKPGNKQLVELDRLDLADGERCYWQFFYAHRNGTGSIFRFRTNVQLESSTPVVTVSHPFD